MACLITIRPSMIHNFNVFRLAGNRRSKTTNMAVGSASHLELQNSSSATCGWCHACAIHSLCCQWIKPVTCSSWHCNSTFCEILPLLASEKKKEDQSVHLKTVGNCCCNYYWSGSEKWPTWVCQVGLKSLTTAGDVKITPTSPWEINPVWMGLKRWSEHTDVTKSFPY